MDLKTDDRRRSDALRPESLGEASQASVQRALAARALDPTPAARKPITLVGGAFVRLVVDR